MTNCELELIDGRTIGYAEWGPPDAPVVLYCHGIPGSHVEAEVNLPTLQQHALDVRLVALDRPGFAASTFQPGRTFLDWPQDVAQVAEQLGIDRFSVLGVSGGAPYALAIAHALPECVDRVGLVAAVGPPDAPGMDRAAILGLSGLDPIRRLQLGMIAFMWRGGREERFIRKSGDQMTDGDRAVLLDPANRRVFVESMRASFAQGNKGASYEAGMFARPWGFDPAEVQVETHVWHGGDDRMVPASVGRWLAERIPGARGVEWPTLGHFSWTGGETAVDPFKTVAGVA